MRSGGKSECTETSNTAFFFGKPNLYSKKTSSRLLPVSGHTPFFFAEVLFFFCPSEHKMLGAICPTGAYIGRKRVSCRRSEVAGAFLRWCVQALQKGSFWFEVFRIPRIYFPKITFPGSQNTAESSFLSIRKTNRDDPGHSQLVRKRSCEGQLLNLFISQPTENRWKAVKKQLGIPRIDFPRIDFLKWQTVSFGCCLQVGAKHSKWQLLNLFISQVPKKQLKSSWEFLE